MMVDIKNGESYEGTLAGCDLFMNLKLTKVIITTQNGAFSRCDEVFVRGNNVKTIQFNPEVLEKH
jgi:U6 snRNA-associated Sm-like protein LSm4